MVARVLPRSRDNCSARLPETYWIELGDKSARGNEAATRVEWQDMRPPTTSPLVPPRCELCGGTMKLHRREPRLGTHPELLSFRCQQCSHVVTLVEADER